MPVNKDFIRIINEEISEFDYLNNDKQMGEDKNDQLLLNQEFQKQFIIDSLQNRNKITENVVDSSITDNMDGDIATFSVEYITDIEYTFDPNESPVSFQLYLNGVNIRCNLDNQTSRGDYDMPDDNTSVLTHVEWNDVEVLLYTKGGDDIKFIAYENASPKIKGFFVKKYLANIVADNIAPFK